jgi:hypothetical protein
MKIFLSLCVTALAALCAQAQVSTETELSNSKTTNQSRPGFYIYAKPFEVTMTVNLWGEIPQQGVYVLPTSTDIVQLISFAGGPRERSSLEDVIIYRAPAKKDQKARQILTVNVRDILEGRSPTVPLAPGDMIVIKMSAQTFTWQDVLTIINTAASLTILYVTIRNLK